MPNSNLSLFKDKAVLITGGTGSFGRAMAKKLIKDTKCHKVIILSRDEWKQWEMRNSDPLFNDPRMRYFLGDVRDKDRLARAFNEVDFIVHAAALKQVPAAEYNPAEFIKTNVHGAMNVIDQAIDSKIQKVIALSTDKAVNPINLYGATKLCSDRLFVAGNAYVGAEGTPKLSVVRYGNVLGSRGSVIPFWKNLIANGATSLPITDERMTRFWITLDQSVELVLNAFNEMRGGEIFIPKIPSMRIEDLAKAIAPDLPLIHQGIREGEKLHELMIGTEDARHTFEYKTHYLIVPEMHIHNEPFMKTYMEGRTGKQLPEGFSYCSNTNKEWLSVEDLRKLLPSVNYI